MWRGVRRSQSADARLGFFPCGVVAGGHQLTHLPPPGQPFHVAFKPKINEFRGRRTAEMEIVDWRPAGVDVAVELPVCERVPEMAKPV